jgi:hypothetical protein
MQQAMVGVVLAVIAAAGEAPTTAPDTWRALRPESAAVRTLVARGKERSGTFRDLTGRLNGSDIITSTTRVAAELGSTSEAANTQGLEWPPSSKSRTRIVAGTVVSGDVDTRTLAAAIEALPRPPERIVMVDTKDLPPTQESRLRGLDAFVLSGSRVICLRRQSPTLRAAEDEGGPYVLMLAVVIWHEMAHAEGLDERQAQEREEDLWKAFTGRGLVDSAVGLSYLTELRRRR